MKNFNLTPKRIEVMRWLKEHPGAIAGYMAQECLASRDEYWATTSHGVRPLWPQSATRMGSGYAARLMEQGLVRREYADCGWGRLWLTDKGLAKLAELDQA